jgi:hypothetical protein
MYAVGLAFAANFIASAAQVAYGLEIFKCSKTLLNMMGGEMELVKAAGICMFNGALGAGHMLLGYRMQYPAAVQPLVINYEKPRTAPANQRQRSKSLSPNQVLQHDSKRKKKDAVVIALPILNPNFEIAPPAEPQPKPEPQIQKSHTRGAVRAPVGLRDTRTIWRNVPAAFEDSMHGLFRVVVVRNRTRSPNQH